MHIRMCKLGVKKVGGVMDKQVEIEDIINELKNHNKYGLENVQKAYKLAEEKHRGVYRQSGEPYITHPLWVAQNLLDMQVWDPDMICAALLHDAIEDSDLTKQEIATDINPAVADLVDGVTKIRRMNFNSKHSQNLANTRKIVTGLNEDYRIIIIKLADRLHNMRTLEYKTPEKQLENALETLEIFVPLANSLGMYKIKSDLEDLSLMYIHPDKYQEIVESKEKLENGFKSDLYEIMYKIGLILEDKEIPFEFKLRTKNVYQTYLKVLHGYKIENIYDLYYIKTLTDEIDNCYKILGAVHSYPPISDRFKDYINTLTQRTNLYQSLHTAIVGPNNRLVKVKIRTEEMDRISAFGYTALVNKPDGPTRSEVQDMIRTDNQFAKRLKEIDRSIKDDSSFDTAIKSDLLSEKIYPYSESGVRKELPKGSTIFDYVAMTEPDRIKDYSKALVNEKEVELDYQIRNNDRIVLVPGEINSIDGLNEVVKTQKAKNLIKRMQ